jgi:transposase
MSMTEEFRTALAAKFAEILPHLDERQRRLLLAAEAKSLGHGGIRTVARAAGTREATVSLGIAELKTGDAPLGRARREGAGRKRASAADPGLRPALLALVEPGTRGDPMSPLRWTTKSTRNLATALTTQGHRISADTVAALLREEGFSLQSNVKTLEGKQNPDRDAQFRYINDQVSTAQRAGEPVVSVDTKKKELIGDYKNTGREWHPTGHPVAVDTHDFPSQASGKAVPYGIYDLAANTGWVNVGTDHDTAAFAVESLRRWWNGTGHTSYPDATTLLITADAGGSNSYRTRAWKTELAALAAETGLLITVCHFPPGTSKWNTIEHRLFCHITMNWRGRPLTSHEVVLSTIAATTTRTGLTVRSELDIGSYPTGVTITDQQMDALAITRHDWHGEWNYTLAPHQPTAALNAPPPPEPTDAHRTWLTHPALTGLPPADWDTLLIQLATPHDEQREDILHTRRGAVRQAAPGPGRRPVLTLGDRVAMTLIRQRFSLPVTEITQLFDVSATTVHTVIRETAPILKRVGHVTEPGTPLTTLAQFHDHLTASGITPEDPNKPTL